MYTHPVQILHCILMFNYIEIFQECIKTSCNVVFFQIMKQVPVRFDPKILHIPAYSGMDLLNVPSSARTAETHCCKTCSLPLQIIHGHSFRTLNYSEIIVVYAVFLARPILSSLCKYKHLNDIPFSSAFLSYKPVLKTFAMRQSSVFSVGKPANFFSN